MRAETLRRLLAIAQAIGWSGRCHGLPAELLGEVEAALALHGAPPAAGMMITALKAIERHHADKVALARWQLVVAALDQVIRGEIERMEGT